MGISPQFCGAGSRCRGKKAGGRNLELDGLRGLAILLVVVWHYVGCLVHVPQPAVMAIVKAVKWTWSGVDLFFVLSGFLIGGILIDNKGSPRLFSVFYLRRACRILPLYGVLLGFFVLAGVFNVSNDWLFSASIPAWPYFVFLQNFWMDWASTFGANWIGITWSLAIEEQFYLILPALVLLLTSCWHAVAALVLVVAAPVFRTIEGGLGAYVLPYCRADSLMLGVTLAVFYRSPYWDKSRGTAIKVPLLMAFAVIPPLTYLASQQRFTIGSPEAHFGLSLLYGAVLCLVLYWGGRSITAPLRSSAMLWLGTRSYGVYLLHQPIQGMLFGFIIGRPPQIADLPSLAVMLAAVGATVIVAEMSYQWLEQPLIRWGHCFTYDRAVVPRATTSAVSRN